MDGASEVPARLAELWFEYWRRHAGSREERLALELGRPRDVQAANDWVEERVFEGGTGALDVLVILAEAAPTDHERLIVGVGPIEDLLTTHGDAIVDPLLDRARRSPAVGAALAHVSVSGAVSAASLAKLERYRTQS